MTKKRRLKKSVKITVGILIGLLVLIVGLFVWKMLKPKEEGSPTPTPTLVPTAEPIALEPYELPREKIMELHDEYVKNHAINDEIVGTLYFNSGIIHQPVVYDPTNNKYIRTNWETMEYDPVGSAFMDFRNGIDDGDQNTIIYGHYVYESYSSDRTLMFTPIDLLRDEKNYEANKYITFVTENDIRYYQLAVIFDCPLVTIDDLQYTPDELQYNLIEYEDEYFNLYTNTLKQYEFYDTGVPLKIEDYMLTLQTCVEGSEDKRLVAIAKEIVRYDYETYMEGVHTPLKESKEEGSINDSIAKSCPFEVIEVKKEEDGIHYIGENNELTLFITDEYEEHVEADLTIHGRSIGIMKDGTDVRWWEDDGEHIITVKEALTQEEWEAFLTKIVK